MNLDHINTLLSTKKMQDNLFDVVSLLLKRIENNEIITFKVSDNIYPASHFIEICSSRLDYMKKKKANEPTGYKKTLDLLKQFNGSIRIGYMTSHRKEDFVLYFQEDLKRIVALYCTDYTEPIVLNAKNGVP